MIKLISKVFIFFLVLIALAVVSFLVYVTSVKYLPEEIATISSFEDSMVLDDSKSFSVLTWNIGYAGLGDDMDFFYDGGSMVMSTEYIVRKNLFKIGSFLKKNDSVDFILLQEVDVKSKRSYSINQIDFLNENLISHFPFFAINYHVPYVPVPLLSPLGKVESGLCSLTKDIPYESKRYSFPGNYPWPKRVFMLDRCFLVNRYKVANGKELIVVNTHNSAYDDGSLRTSQMLYLKAFLEAEYKKGNFIVVGGDWNQCPPGLKSNFQNYIFDQVDYFEIDFNYLPQNWQWAYSPEIPTNRRLMEPYNQKTTPVTLIDFYLCSPNILIESLETIDLNFLNSDHNPVKLKFRLENRTTNATGN